MWWPLPVLTCLVPVMDTGAVRVELSGALETEVSADGRFAVHYTLEGDDAVQGELGPGGVPELVLDALAALELAESTFLDRGYRPLVDDEGIDGSNALDVYVRDIDANGYAHPVARTDGAGDSCWMELDNTLTVQGVVESVAIHELHHCVQYRYARTHGWIHEATATYEQYLTWLDPLLEVAVLELWRRRLDEPQLPMDWTDGQFEYAGLFALQFWEEFGGEDPSRVPDLWEALALEPDDWKQAFDTEAQRVWGVSWDDMFLEFATWNAFACRDDDGAHYAHDRLPCNEIIAVPRKRLTWDGRDAWFDVKLREGTHSGRYAQVDDDHPSLDITVECSSPRGGAALLTRLVHVDAEGKRVASAEGPSGEVWEPVRLPGRRAPDGAIRVISASVGEEDVVTQCHLKAVRPEDGGCGCANGPGSGAWWLALPLLGLRARREPARR